MAGPQRTLPVKFEILRMQLVPTSLLLLVMFRMMSRNSRQNPWHMIPGKCP
jgi:hypothetical protein